MWVGNEGGRRRWRCERNVWWNGARRFGLQGENSYQRKLRRARKRATDALFECGEGSCPSLLPRDEAVKQLRHDQPHLRGGRDPVRLLYENMSDTRGQTLLSDRGVGDMMVS